MKKLLFVILMSVSFLSYGQTKLTQKQIERKHYQEVIGENSKDTIIPDTYPKYPYGMQGVLHHISSNLNYPSEAYNKKIQGTVLLKFFVETDGTLGDIEVIKSVEPSLDAEAIRVLKMLKVWVPGYKNGLPVRVEYKFPFAFKIR